MEQIIEGLASLRQIHKKHEISSEKIEQQAEAFRQQKVSIPIIGKFSAGKSALLNALLGYSRKMLREDLTPETAVPTEIFYTENQEECTAFYGEETKSYTIEEYRQQTFDSAQVQKVSIQLNNNFLEQIKDVMLVDMPGYDSGYDVHNQAIDRYLPQSLAYIVAFPAEDMALKYNMVGTLKELLLNEMPICIVITKQDKVTPEILDENLAKLKADLAKHFGGQQFSYCVTSSKLGEVDDVRHFLVSVQSRSQEIIGQKYRKILGTLAHETEIYLTTFMQQQNFTVSELLEKEATLKKEIEQIKSGIDSESDSLQRLLPKCIDNIKNEILCALQENESTFVAMMLNGQDISERVNQIVRSAVTEGIKKHFVPNVQRYLEQVSQRIQTLASADGGLWCDKLHVDANSMTKTIVHTSVAAIGLLLLGPLLTLVGGVIAWFVGKRNKEQERERQKQSVLQKLHSEVFPTVISQVSAQLEIELVRNAAEIEKALKEELNGRYTMASEALAEVMRQREAEDVQKERQIEELTQEIARVKEILDECA